MTGGKTLIDMRRSGVRPPGMVIVTESGEIARNARQRDLYPLVFSLESEEDWRLVHGLNVGLCTRLDRPKVAPICMAILEARPRLFGVTYLGGEEIEHETIIGEACHAVR